MRGGFALAIATLAVFPITILVSSADQLPADLPLTWSVEQFCAAGQELPPPATDETYSYLYDIAFLYRLRVNITIWADGNGSLRASETRDELRTNLIRETSEIALDATDVACIRGVIAKMAFWSSDVNEGDYIACADGDYFSLTGRRNGVSLERTGGCGGGNFAPYYQVIEDLLLRLGAFPVAEQTRQ